MPVSARSAASVAGQALVPAMALLAVGGIAWVGVYQVGQTAGARARLTHASDAAVYSAALAQARALNLLAYVNRAQVAHQVAMAHLVTLAAWAQFSSSQAGRRTIGNPPAYLISSLFGAQAGRGYQAARDVGDMPSRLARQVAEHDTIVHEVLARAAQRQLAQAAPQRDAMFESVLRANYPELAARPGALRWQWLEDTWPGFVQSRPGRGETPLAEMVGAAAARHDFLRPRNFTRRSSWIVQTRCPHRRHELRRRGATQMDARGRWSATDTLSFHALRSNRWIGCYYREYAMGWGLAGKRGGGTVVERAPEDFSQQDFWRWVHANTSWDIFSGTGNPLASAYAGAGLVSASGKGLPDFHEVPHARMQAGPRMAVAVQQSTDSFPLQAPMAGQFRWRVFDAADTLTVTTAAEIFQSRDEPRGDGRQELATLFRPNWQARRVAVSASTQQAAGRAP